MSVISSQSIMQGVIHYTCMQQPAEQEQEVLQWRYSGRTVEKSFLFEVNIKIVHVVICL